MSRDGEEERGEKDEAEHLDEEPGAHLGVDEVPAAVGDDTLDLEEEVGEEDESAALGEAEGDAVDVDGLVLLELVMEGLVRDGTLEDDHSDAGRDGGEEEEEGEEGRVPERGWSLWGREGEREPREDW